MKKELKDLLLELKEVRGNGEKCIWHKMHKEEIEELVKGYCEEQQTTIWKVIRMIIWNDSKYVMTVSEITFNVSFTVELLKELGFNQIRYQNNSTEAMEWVAKLLESGYRIIGNYNDGDKYHKTYGLIFEI